MDKRFSPVWASHTVKKPFGDDVAAKCLPSGLKATSATTPGLSHFRVSSSLPVSASHICTFRVSPPRKPFGSIPLVARHLLSGLKATHPPSLPGLEATG